MKYKLNHYAIRDFFKIDKTLEPLNLVKALVKFDFYVLQSDLAMAKVDGLRNPMARIK